MLLGGVFPRGGRLELGEAGIGLALRTKRQGADHGGLDVDLARPVAELGGARRIAQGREPCLLLARLAGVAAAGGADAAGKGVDRLGLWILLPGISVLLRLQRQR